MGDQNDSVPALERFSLADCESFSLADCEFHHELKLFFDKITG